MKLTFGKEGNIKSITLSIYKKVLIISRLYLYGGINFKWSQTELCVQNGAVDKNEHINLGQLNKVHFYNCKKHFMLGYLWLVPAW